MIAPQTDVYLLNTPLHSDGVNTLTWSSETRQYNYFYSRRVFTLTNFYYQRKDFALKVEIPVDELYGKIDYMMYRNNAYTNKWFYAFIDDIVYVNDTTSLIYIRTDEFQTWYFDIQFNPCFVVREHTNDDTIGANRTDEGLGLGAYICNKKETMWTATDNPRIAMLAPVNVNSIEGVVVSGTPIRHTAPRWCTVDYTQFYNATGWTGYILFKCSNVGTSDEDVRIRYDVYKVATLEEAQQMLITNTPLNKIEELEMPNLYGVYPSAFPPYSSLATNYYAVSFSISATQSGGEVTTESYVTYLNHNILGYNFRSGGMTVDTVQRWISELNRQSLSDDIGALYLIPPRVCGSAITDSNNTSTKRSKTFTLVRSVNGYVPKNNKLYIYPYTVVKVHNANDSARVLQPELFSTYGTCVFSYWSSFQPNCNVIGVPNNYAGVAESLEYAINSAKYPLSRGRYNGFQNYLGIHSAERNIAIASGVINTAMSAIPFLMGGVGPQNALVNQDPWDWWNSSLAYHRSNALGTHTNVRAIDRGNTQSRGSAASGLVNNALGLAQTLAEDNAKQNERFGTIGSIDNNNLNAVNAINIYIEQQTITYDYAKRIDDFFSMYGYKTNQLKTPNITGRLNWNYVQVANANITGAIPNDSMDRIRAMLESGVTFWHNPSTYMDYSQANTIVP